MHVRSSLISILMMTLSSSVALGQPTTSAPASGGRGDSLATGRGVAGQHMLYFDSLKTTVKLDEEQQHKVRGLLKSADEEFRAARADMIPSPEVTRRMAESVKQIEAAKKAGDSEQELALIKQRTELVKSFTEKRQQMIVRMNARDEALQNEIAALLRPDQRESFKTFWPNRITSIYGPTKNPYDGMIRSPIALKTATDRLGDLTADQKSGISTALKAYQDATRATTQPSDPAKSPDLTKLYNDVFAILTDAQGQRVKQELSPKKDPHGNATTSAPAGDVKPAPAAKAP